MFLRSQPANQIVVQCETSSNTPALKFVLISITFLNVLDCGIFAYFYPRYAELVVRILGALSDAIFLSNPLLFYKKLSY